MWKLASPFDRLEAGRRRALMASPRTGWRIAPRTMRSSWKRLAPCRRDPGHRSRDRMAAGGGVSEGSRSSGCCTSDGSASGPGSWPPAYFTSAWTREFYGRVGREQVGKALARVVDAQFHHRGGRAGQFAAVLDLAQRRDHGVRVLGQFDRAGVGQEFARARQRQPHELRQQPRQHDQHHRDDDHDDRAAAGTLAVAVGRG